MSFFAGIKKMFSQSQEQQEAKIATAESGLAGLEQSLLKAQEEAELARQEKARFEAEILAKKNEKVALREQEEKKRRECEEASSRLEEVAKEIASIKGTITASEESIAQAQEAIVRIEQEKTAFETQEQSRLRDLQVDCKKAKELVASQESQIVRVQEEIQRFEAEGSDTDAKQILQDILSSEQAERSALEQTKSALVDLQQKIENVATTASQKKGFFSSFKKLFTSDNKESENLTAEKEALEVKRQAIEGRLIDYAKNRIEAEKLLREREQMAASYAASLASAEEEKAKAEEAFIAATKGLSDQEQEGKARLAQFALDLTSWNETIEKEKAAQAQRQESLQEKTSRYETELLSLEASKAELARQKEEDEESVDTEREARLVELSEKFDEARKRVADLEAEYKVAQEQLAVFLAEEEAKEPEESKEEGEKTPVAEEGATEEEKPAKVEEEDKKAPVAEEIPVAEKGEDKVEEEDKQAAVAEEICVERKGGGKLEEEKEEAVESPVAKEEPEEEAPRSTGFFSAIKRFFGGGKKDVVEPKEESPSEEESTHELTEAELAVRLRTAEPKLSVWLDIVLEGVEESGDLLNSRVAFLLRSLQAPEDEIEKFVSDFAGWLDRMEYYAIDEFRSELQYRLALALSLEDEEDERNRLLLKLSSGLAKTREQFAKQLEGLFASHGELDDDFWEEMEELFIMADLGYEASVELVNRLKENVRKNKLKTSEEVKEVLREEIKSIFTKPRRIVSVTPPEVVLMIGVNGAGKTTTIAKLAYRDKMQGKKVMIAAADTFRAAAIDQMRVWAERVGTLFHAKQPGSDPASVAYEAMERALAEKVDVLYVDTAGRLQTKVNLMDELAKIRQVIGRKHPGAPHRIVLVLDATTGQNALSQAKLFKESAGVDELILTKLDGTAKGGVAIAVSLQHKLPISYIGLGEKVEDLRPFNGDDYADALLKSV